MINIFGSERVMEAPRHASAEVLAQTRPAISPKGNSTNNTITADMTKADLHDQAHLATSPVTPSTEPDADSLGSPSGHEFQQASQDVRQASRSMEATEMDDLEHKESTVNGSPVAEEKAEADGVQTKPKTYQIAEALAAMRQNKKVRLS
jgi:hypothetical protein